MCRLCKIVAGIGIASCLIGSDAFADPLSGRQAKKMLVKPKGAEVEVVSQDFLSGKDAKILIAVGGQQKYYGAIAAAPKAGLAAESTVAAADFHSLDPAKAFALKGCNAARKGGPECVIVALIRPKGWKETGFQLSLDASVGFRKTFMRGGKPRAFAISQETGRFVITKGDGAADAALAQCNAAAGTGDCEVVVTD
jgi:hypothetical protein